MFKIDKSNVEDILALTPLQMGIIFHYLKEPEGNLYFEQLSIGIAGKIDIHVFEKAWQYVVDTNQMLRTVFIWENLKEPVQIILKEHKCDIKYFDFSQEKSKYESMGTVRNEDKMAKFDLNYVPFRIILSKLSQDTYELIISSHHIIYDGWSTGIILKEFFSIYEDLLNKRQTKRYDKLKFKDYVKYLLQRNENIEKDYWGKYLDNLYDLTELSIKKNKKDRKDCFAIHTEKNSSDAVNNYAIKNNITIASLIYCAYGLLLQIYNNSNDVVFGTVVSGRPAEMSGVEFCVGQFINTIPFRLRYDEDSNIMDLLLDIKEQLIERKEHEYLSITKIKETIGLGGNNELFDSIVVIENYPLDKNILNNQFSLQISSFSMDETTNYDLTVCVKMLSDNIEIEFTYNQAVYETNEIERFAAHYINIVNFIMNNPGKMVSEIQALPELEKKQLIFDLNSNNKFYKKCTLQDIFEKQVKATPEKMAVIDPNSCLSFKKLNDKVNKTAFELRKMGVGRDTIVGLMVERSIYSIIGVLAIIKAGGAYTSIDMDYPLKRKRYIIDDCKINIILTQKHLASHADLGTEVLLLDETESYVVVDEDIVNINTPADLAYIIYTSGSTGNPKGVMVEHHSVINLAFSQIEYFGIKQDERILLFAPLYFDASVEQMFISLFSGATLVVPNKDIILDGSSFKKFLRDNRVTHLHTVPSFLNNINLDDSCFLKRVIAGGDVCTKSIAQKWYKQCAFYNEYGPTETTVTSIEYLVSELDEEQQHILIGKPIPNTTVYIFDNKMRISPIGAIGELYIGGEGVARGYLNQAQLASEKFIYNPYNNGERIYKTGDLVKRLDDGNIKFIARNDNQVKIRGHRIETGEVESVLLKIPQVKEAIVVARMDEHSNKSLWAYITVRSDTSLEYLHKQMSIGLPEYMIPAYFVVLDKLPLTNAGKIDLNMLKSESLSVPPLKSKDKVLSSPKDVVEEKIAKVWREVLGVETINANDNFFFLGGDSIKAIQVVSRLKVEGYSINIGDLLKNPILSDTALCAKAVSNERSISRIEGKVNFTPIQRWFVESNFSEMYHWNQAVMLYKADGFDIKVVNSVFRRIVEHHDTLRLRLSNDNSCLVYSEEIVVETELFDLINFEIPGEEIIKRANILQRSIDIYGGPLMKLGLFRTLNGDHLLIIIHHLIIDGVSWRILFEDFDEGYRKLTTGREIEFLDKTDSFKKWSEVLYEYSKSKELLKEKAFWGNISTQQTESKLFTSEEIVKKSNEAAVCTIELSQDDTRYLLEDINKVYSTEIDDILLSALSLSIEASCESDSILVNLERHGRENTNNKVDVTRTVGWFTSQFPIMLPLNRNDLSKHIISTKETLRKIPNKGIGYGVLRYISVLSEHDKDCLNNNPKISFNYMGQFDQDLKNKVFSISPYDVGDCVGADFNSLYVINVNGIIKGSVLSFTFRYDDNKISRKDAETLSENYKNSLLIIIEHCRHQDEMISTPSDYDAKNLSTEELEYINSLYG